MSKQCATFFWSETREESGSAAKWKHVRLDQPQLSLYRYIGNCSKWSEDTEYRGMIDVDHLISFAHRTGLTRRGVTFAALYRVMVISGAQRKWPEVCHSSR